MRRGISSARLGAALAILCWCCCDRCAAQPKKVQAGNARERAREAAGVVEGAVWGFKLEPAARVSGNAKSREVIAGQYRLLDLKIYQAEKPDGEMKEQVGVSKPNTTKTTIAEFQKLRGTNRAGEWTELKGIATMKITSGGFWEGEFVDSEGFKWKMKTRRIQE